jgi:hypothetical protein
MFDLGEKIRLQSYIRPVGAGGFSLLALMEFAGEGLISCKSSKDQSSFRFASRGPTCHAINRASTCATFQSSTSVSSLTGYAARAT